MLPEQVWDLLPKERPRAPAWAVRAAEEAKFSPREFAAYVWAMTLLSEMRPLRVRALVGDLTRAHPMIVRTVDISAGFIPVKANGNSSGDRGRIAQLISQGTPTVKVGDTTYAFGVVVGLEVEELHFPDLGIPQPESYENRFPLIYELRSIENHAPFHPRGVSAACYAEPKAGKRFYGPAWQFGIVTARHVLAGVGFATGTRVPMDDGTECALVDVDGATTIDAAVLDCPNIPLAVERLRLATVAPGTMVEVKTAKSGTITSHVLRVFEDPHYFGNLITHRIFIDKCGASGDSGSLVLQPDSGYGAGIYIGKTAEGEGLVQCIHQVAHYFSIDLYL